MKNIILVLGLSLVSVCTYAQSQGQGQRACDTYIQQYCTSSSDHGPGCLKGHESDVSAACLKDMQQKGAPPSGGRSQPTQSQSSQ